MKKLIILSLLMGVLTACGNDGVNTTSKSYKKEILTKAYKKHDIEAQKKHIAIRKELGELANAGNKSAEKEIKNWKQIEEDFRAEIMLEPSVETKEYVKKIREKYGN